MSNQEQSELSLDLYDFELPEEQIAAYPSAKRGDDRLLVLDRSQQQCAHRRFAELLEFINPGDLLVFNNIRVRKARLEAVKPTGGRVELLLLQPRSDGLWECLTKSARPVKEGTELTVADRISCRVEAREDGYVLLRFAEPLTEELIEKIGSVPLPPYIIRQRANRTAGDTVTHEQCAAGGPDGLADSMDDSMDDSMGDSMVVSMIDEIRYQTVYAERTGAVAAPTAGLHFTRELLHSLTEKGVSLGWLSLEVGWGTFAPVKDDDITAHRMHAERYHIPEETAEAVQQTRARGGRVIAVGTTVVRALESAAGEDGILVPGENSTEIFIYPGYRFKAVDGMVTNFHTPRSTLLMMISAFAGRERVMEVYRDAVQRNYRFFSYGDAMLIV